MNLSNPDNDNQPDDPGYNGPEQPGYSGPGRGREPVFNLPSVIVWLAAVMFVVHVVREYFCNLTRTYGRFTHSRSFRPDIPTLLHNYQSKWPHGGAR